MGLHNDNRNPLPAGNHSNHNPNRLAIADLSTPPDADEAESSCSTPYHSAPSSPSRSYPSHYFSAPTSPMHYICASITPASADDPAHLQAPHEFEFSSRLSDSSDPAAAAALMISADELFLNGQIRPMKLSFHRRLPDLDDDSETATRGRDARLRSRSVNRRARSMSPLRNAWDDDDEEGPEAKPDPEPKSEIGEGPTQSVSASSSRSSSSGRSSKRWIFLKDLLYRSKSEGRANPKDKFWSGLHQLSQSRDKPLKQKEKGEPSSSSGAARSEGQRRRKPSAHERHYAVKRAEAEEMRRRTFLPYRAGLFGCLGFSSRSYGAVSGIARTWNVVSSR